MHQFKLRRADLTDDPSSLPFPAEAVHELTSNAEPVDALDLAHKIDHTLDEMQRQLDHASDELEELDEILHFPQLDDIPPPAA